MIVKLKKKQPILWDITIKYHIIIFKYHQGFYNGKIKEICLVYLIVEKIENKQIFTKLKHKFNCYFKIRHNENL